MARNAGPSFDQLFPIYPEEKGSNHGSLFFLFQLLRSVFRRRLSCAGKGTALNLITAEAP